MDANDHSTPLPSPISTEATPVTTPPMAPQTNPAPSITNDMQAKPKSSVFSLPMKVALLIFISILGVGALVFSQKNKMNSSYAQNQTADAKQTAAVPLPSPTVDATVLAVSPTVVGEIPLEITSPQNGTTVTSPNVVITGKTSPNADITINDTDKKADAQGNFSVSILIDQGDNIITVTSVDANGKYAEKEIKITLNTGA